MKAVGLILVPMLLSRGGVICVTGLSVAVEVRYSHCHITMCLIWSWTRKNTSLNFSFANIDVQILLRTGTWLLPPFAAYRQSCLRQPLNINPVSLGWWWLTFPQNKHLEPHITYWCHELIRPSWPGKGNWAERRGSRHLRNASCLLSLIKSHYGWNVALKKFDKQVGGDGELLGLSSV